MAKDTDTVTYFQNAATWEEEIYQKTKTANRRLQISNFILLSIVGLLGLALILLIPLKEFQPYVIQVDETGTYKASHLAMSGPLTQDEAVLKSLVGQYVIMRETYDVHDGEQRFIRIMEQSQGQAAQSYRNLWVTSNPDNPFVLLGKEARTTVEINSISLLNNRTANVSYTLFPSRSGTPKTPTTHVAIVGFDFVSRDLPLSGIIRNPLGFYVNSWRSDEVYKGE